MNFESIIFLLIVLIFCGCGVKSDPIAPPDSFQLPDPSAKYQYVPKAPDAQNAEDELMKEKTIEGTMNESKDSN